MSSGGRDYKLRRLYMRLMPKDSSGKTLVEVAMILMFMLKVELELTFAERNQHLSSPLRASQEDQD